MESYAYLNGELINLYTKDNPILESGDECYGLIFNVDSFHRPLLIRGLIIQDKFVDGMNKVYYVRILEIMESPKILNEFVYSNTFVFNPIINETITNKKNVLITKTIDFNKYAIKIQSYFIRNSLTEIKKLRTEYISIVRKDVEKMLQDINNIEQQVE